MEIRDVCAGIQIGMLWLCTTMHVSGAAASAEHSAVHFHPLCLSLPVEKKQLQGLHSSHAGASVF